MEKIDELAKIIWDYHHMNMPLKKADAIFVLGSHDTSVAEYAAELYLKGLAPLMIFSGGSAHNGDLLHTGWNKTEAEILSEIAIENGVPENKILLEKKATNTGENIIFTKQLLADHKINCNSFILVQKPYMERRTYATFKKQWPEKEFLVTSSPMSFQEYIERDIPKEVIINIMVGDLQRIIEYPKKGFQTYQEVPDGVMAAYNELIRQGYADHLIKG